MYRPKRQTFWISNECTTDMLQVTLCVASFVTSPPRAQDIPNQKKAIVRMILLDSNPAPINPRLTTPRAIGYWGNTMEIPCSTQMTSLQLGGTPDVKSTVDIHPGLTPPLAIFKHDTKLSRPWNSVLYYPLGWSHPGGKIPSSGSMIYLFWMRVNKCQMIYMSGDVSSTSCWLTTKSSDVKWPSGGILPLPHVPILKNHLRYGV